MKSQCGEQAYYPGWRFLADLGEGLMLGRNDSGRAVQTAGQTLDETLSHYYANLGPVDSQLAAEDIFCFGESRHLCSILICSTARLSTPFYSRRSRRHNSISSSRWPTSKSSLIMNISSFTISWAGHTFRLGTIRSARPPRKWKRAEKW